MNILYHPLDWFTMFALTSKLICWYVSTISCIAWLITRKFWHMIGNLGLITAWSFHKFQQASTTRLRLKRLKLRVEKQLNMFGAVISDQLSRVPENCSVCTLYNGNVFSKTFLSTIINKDVQSFHSNYTFCVHEQTTRIIFLTTANGPTHWKIILFHQRPALIIFQDNHVLRGKQFVLTWIHACI